MKIIERIMCFLGFERVVSASNTMQWRWRRKVGVPAPVVAPTPTQPQDAFKYLINDWMTPDLVKVMSPPSPPNTPPFVVHEYVGGGTFNPSSKEAVAANCYTTIAGTLNYMFSQTNDPFKSWAGTRNLNIIPRAGKDLNAYYNRTGLVFFWYMDPTVNRIIYTADSSDIVSHELGHAILDSYRPDTWAGAALEVWSFHEAFADLTSLLHLMTYEEALVYAINQTNGDLSKPNVISNIAEDVGRAIAALTGDPTRSANCLRSAINDFKYVNPSSLPTDAPNDQLAAECHSFGRVFLGAFYDILVGIYNLERKEKTNLEALKSARDVMASYALKAIQNSPLTSRFYDAMAKTWVWVSINNHDGKYKELIQECLLNRNLITPTVSALSTEPCPNVDNIVKVQSVKSLKLSDAMLTIQSDNPLMGVELQLLQDEAVFYDNNGMAFDSVSVSEDDTLADALCFISFLHKTNSVGNGEDTPFEIRDGKLTRTHFQ